MDFQRFGIDPRLARAAEGLPTNLFFYEKMLTHVVEGKENVCVKIALDNGREEVLLLPALHWLLLEEGRRVLVVVPDAESAERCSAAIGRLGSGADIAVCQVTRCDNPEEPIALEGDPKASVLIGRLEDFLASPDLSLRDYGFLVIDGVDRLAELPSDSIRKFCGLLLPSWERRSVLACAKLSVKAKNLAWDLADNPVEFSIEGEVAKAQSVLKETWSVPAESKIKFLLGLIAREKPSRLCVFCNLKDTAIDAARRLTANGISTDSIIGALQPERKFALIEKFRAGDSTCLVLSDEGAEGLSPGVFPLIVNFDIPLEAELFVKRLEMLDRSDSRAKVVSLACDRYIYGLPGIEQYIDAKLDPLPIDESMLCIADKSEGSADRRPRGDSYARDPRRVPPQRRETHGRESRPRDPGQSGPQPRDSNRFRDMPREGRSPDIRKSISEATGGALDMSSALPPDSGYPRPAQAAKISPMRGPAQGESRRGQNPRGQRPPESRPQGKKEGGNKDSRRGNAKPPAQRVQGPRQQSSQQMPPKPQAPKNPYDMPMEERMKLYREKYGHDMGKENGPGERGDRQDRKNDQAGGQRSGQGGATRGGPKSAQEGQQGRHRGRPGGQKQTQEGQAAPGPGNEEARRQPRPAKLPEGQPLPRAPGSEGEKKPETPAKLEGVVGRLLGALRKKRG